MKDFKYLYVCPECYEGIRRLEGVVCKICMKPMNAEFMTLCRECEYEKRHFTYIAAAGVYSGALKEMIHLAKFYGRESAARVLADFINENIMETAVKWADVLVPVPLGPRAKAERGYNQSALVAALLAGRHGVACAEAVSKMKDTPPQNKLERKDRLKNLRRVFKVELPVNGKKVLVVDDVYTTGATMNEMAKALKAAGAVEVRGIVAARSI